jgi:hypothetical protein
MNHDGKCCTVDSTFLLVKRQKADNLETESKDRRQDHFAASLQESGSVMNSGEIVNLLAMLWQRHLHHRNAEIICLCTVTGLHA